MEVLEGNEMRRMTAGATSKPRFASLREYDQSKSFFKMCIYSIIVLEKKGAYIRRVFSIAQDGFVKVIRKCDNRRCGDRHANLKLGATTAIDSGLVVHVFDDIT